MRPLKPLKGVHIVSLALNLPGPAALMRLRAMGARCTKVDPPAGDPMALYCAAAHQEMGAGIRTLSLDLKQAPGQARLDRCWPKPRCCSPRFGPRPCANWAWMPPR
jgi:alpha-methylacyl-CoA racemase